MGSLIGGFVWPLRQEALRELAESQRDDEVKAGGAAAALRNANRFLHVDVKTKTKYDTHHDRDRQGQAFHT